MNSIIWDGYHVAQFRIRGGLHNLRRFGVLWTGYQGGGDSAGKPKTFNEVEEILNNLNVQISAASAHLVTVTNEMSTLPSPALDALGSARDLLVLVRNQLEEIEVAEVSVLSKPRRPCPYDEQ
jgi:hypothetical protein